jgi:hypothetical protein
MKPEKKKILLLSGGAVGKVRSVLQALNLEDLTIHKGGDLMIQDEGDLCGSDWMLLLEVTHLVYSVGSVMEEMFDKRKALFEGLTCKEVDAFIETNLMEPQQVSEAMPELEPIKKVVWVCAELTVEIAYGRTAASIRRRSLRMYRRFMDSAFDTCLDTVFQNALKDEDEGEGSNEP